MPQLNYVDTARRSPTGCFLCGRQTGDFIDCQIPQVSFWTASGVKQTEAWVYLCVGEENNSGCAVQVGRLTGQLVDTFKLDELREQLEQQNEEIADLRGLLAKKTIKVDDLLAANVFFRDNIAV